MLDYTREAARYDATRGGAPRAEAAAEAITSLLPPEPQLLVDVAGGTGVVTAALAARGHHAIVVDAAFGMAAVAADRLPGRVTLGNAAALPLADASVDAVTMIWLLHLLDRTTSATTIAEAARVLRPGGTLITTVDKNDGYHLAPGDASEIIAPARERHFHPNRDAPDRITDLAAAHGLIPSGNTTFLGLGQGRSPQDWRKLLADPESGWLGKAGSPEIASLDARLAALPDQDRTRPDPIYRVIALRKQ